MSTMQLFHGSSHAFDFPNYDAIAANRTGHENGLLGLWVATKSDWIRSFGGHVYAVDVAAEKVIDVTVSQLQKWGSEPAFFTGKRRELLEQGIDYLRLVEIGGNSEMGVVINFDAITAFEPFAPLRANAPPRP